MRHVDELTEVTLKIEYIDNKKSCTEIAVFYNTYPKKISRLLKKFGIRARNRSESQKLICETCHPTRGKFRSEETKLKISETRSAKWDSEARQKASDRVKEEWKTREGKERTLNKCSEGMRAAAKNGSRLERLAWDVLTEMDIIFSENKSILIENENMRVDVWIPSLSLVVEIDGPTHKYPIFSEEKLKKTQEADQRKNTLVLKHGLNLLRVSIPQKNVSQHDQRLIKDAIRQAIQAYVDGIYSGFIRIEVEK